MKYRTTDELGHFNFEEACIAEIRTMGERFLMALDNVKILPENSCNRDIRIMRTNGLELRIEGMKSLTVVEEGYQVYDADGNLLRKEEDRTVLAEEYRETFEELAGCMLYSIEKKDEEYIFSIDTEDHTFLIRVTGKEDIEEWDRFLNLEG